LLSHWLFPIPKLLDKMELATLVCTFLGPRSFTFYSIPQHREQRSMHIVTWQIFAQRRNGWMDTCFLLLFLRTWHSKDVIFPLLFVICWLKEVEFGSD
jgi:hypothetical protein